MARHQPRDAVLLSIKEAGDLGKQALLTIGYAEEEAGAVCAHLIDATCCGYAFAGLPRILEIAEDPRSREPKEAIRVERETPISLLIDGGNHIGYYVLEEAAKMAIDKARASGVALVGVYNTALSGRNTYYLEMIARQNLAGMQFSSAWPVVAPEGGMRPMLGTNPIAIALPTSGDPVIFDMGTAAIMRGELALRSRLNELLPEGAAIDKDGKPTLDPHAALQGCILPFGGRDSHKGFGLSLMIQALGLMAGASLPRNRVQDYGHLFVVFQPGLLVGEKRFKQDLEKLIRVIKATPRRDDVEEVRVPSERSFRERRKAMQEGIHVDREVVEALKTMAAGGQH